MRAGLGVRGLALLLFRVVLARARHARRGARRGPTHGAPGAADRTPARAPDRAPDRGAERAVEALEQVLRRAGGREQRGDLLADGVVTLDPVNRCCGGRGSREAASRRKGVKYRDWDDLAQRVCPHCARAAETGAVTKLHFLSAPLGARALLNISAKFWRISSPD